MPQHLSEEEGAKDGAAPTIQRVATAQGESSPAARRRKPSVSPAAAASERRRIAT